jgi:hypothetical protein
MAHGIPCKYCGRQEGTHTLLQEAEAKEEGVEEERRKIALDQEVDGVEDGYDMSILDCPGYIPEDQKEHDERERESKSSPSYRLYDGEHPWGAD